jgi:hypothetical protein
VRKNRLYAKSRVENKELMARRIAKNEFLLTFQEIFSLIYEEIENGDDIFLGGTLIF